MPPKSRKKANLEKKGEDQKNVALETKSEVKQGPERDDFPIIKTEKELNSERDVAKRLFVNPEDKITDNVLRPPELARILAITAELYSKNQISFTKLTNETNEEQVAIRMLLDRKCPLYLIRVIAENDNGDQICEKWDVNTMTFPNVPILQINHST